MCFGNLGGASPLWRKSRRHLAFAEYVRGRWVYFGTQLSGLFEFSGRKRGRSLRWTGTCVGLACVCDSAPWCFSRFIFTTHYVSLCSISAYLVALIVVSIFGQLGYYGMEAARVWEMDGVLACLTALAIFRHRQNIRRLLNGNENKIFLKKGKKA